MVTIFQESRFISFSHNSIFIRFGTLVEMHGKVLMVLLELLKFHHCLLMNVMMVKEEKTLMLFQYHSLDLIFSNVLKVVL